MRWQFSIDRGGTFTDCVARDPATGALHVAKVPSSDEAPLVAVRAVLGLAPGAPVPPCDVRMGTTVATNALLERRGAATGLCVTEGFGDALAIGTQQRPELFALSVVKPPPLYAAVAEVRARAAPDGTILAFPEEEEVKRALVPLRARGVTSLAVVVLHGYAAPEIERAIARVAHALGFAHVSLSHELGGYRGLVARGDTTVVDAYVTPLVTHYLAALEAALGRDSRLAVMQSSGELCAPSALRGPAALLSGPAGGVVASRHYAASAGSEALIGFDMGGTSTDVCRVARVPSGARSALAADMRYESEIAGLSLRAPMVDVHTVAAGGGSLCRYGDGRFAVGPDSAGARPGPLAYGRPEASELTVTDCDLALGRLVPDAFPLPLDAARVMRALDGVAARMDAERAGAGGDARAGADSEAARVRRAKIAHGFVAVADARMAEAVRRISVARGYDVRTHDLLCFGGAAGQHACAVARELGMARVILPPRAGVLSAFGMGLAAHGARRAADAGHGALDDGALAALEPLLVRLETEVRAELEARGVARAELAVERELELRYRGTEHSVVLPHAPAADIAQAFARAHERELGFSRPEATIELATVRVTAHGGAHDVAAARAGAERTQSPEALVRHAELFTGERFERVPLYARAALRPGTAFDGPAIVVDDATTLVVDADFRLEVVGDLCVLRRVRAPRPEDANASAARDPVRLELCHNRFVAIAEQMGAALRRSASSTNIRERLDFSCALFDATGGLVANAPHIPVHLGAMAETVRALVASGVALAEGDAFASNNPALGGSHLPDVTVVTPVFDRAGALAFFVASRGHHADVGGMTPGSMPADARALADEGIVLSLLRIVKDARLDSARLRAALAAPPYPARHPRENEADIAATLAANQRGAELLAHFADELGWEVVAAYMRHVQDHAAERVAAAIARLPVPGGHGAQASADFERHFADAMDDGAPLVVRVARRAGRLTIDFTGSAGERDDNLNAPLAVTTAAVLYVLRLLAGEPIPLASGCLRAVDLVVPRPSMLAPGPGRAVAAGNVETSQRIVDVLLGALGLAAASQGTMNNLSFGASDYGYYETLGGGAGATAEADGASAVHTHMTNTRLTNPEILEARYPVRVARFAIRRGSGGAGARRGGDGLVRELLFLEPVTLSILSERRRRAPFGLAGGAPGAMGQNYLVRASGVREPLEGRATLTLAAGDRVGIETPGGGAFGPAGVR